MNVQISSFLDIFPDIHNINTKGLQQVPHNRLLQSTRLNLSSQSNIINNCHKTLSQNHCISEVTMAITYTYPDDRYIQTPTNITNDKYALKQQ